MFGISYLVQNSLSASVHLLPSAEGNKDFWTWTAGPQVYPGPGDSRVKLWGNATVLLVFPEFPTVICKTARAWAGSWANPCSTPPLQQFATRKLSSTSGSRSTTTGVGAQQWGNGSVRYWAQSPWSTVSAPSMVHIISFFAQLQPRFQPGGETCRYCCQLNIVTVAWKKNLACRLRPKYSQETHSFDTIYYFYRWVLMKG